MKRVLLCFMTLIIILCFSSCVKDKYVEDMLYSYDGGTGTYSGNVDKNEEPNGRGIWTWKYGESFKEIVAGEWSKGEFISGSTEIFYNNESLGKIAYSNGEANEGDLRKVMQKYQDMQESENSSSVWDLFKGLFS